MIGNAWKRVETVRPCFFENILKPFECFRNEIKRGGPNAQPQSCAVQSFKEKLDAKSL